MQESAQTSCLGLLPEMPSTRWKPAPRATRACTTLLQ